ncbi:MAG: bacteriohemerythrin [Rhodocyclales bacterium]|nr:bacteriohemerythrin [Rhodocyclales bacterium]
MVKALKWTADLSIGIEQIDAQHRRIVDYINQLNDARKTGEKKAVGLVLEGLADYTLSHFGYEEAVMVAARFPGAAQHRRGHERFALQLAEYGHRYALGEEVAAEVLDTLNKWLLNHIKREDHDYMDSVKASLSPAQLAGILADCEAARGTS